MLLSQQLLLPISTILKWYRYLYATNTEVSSQNNYPNFLDQFKEINCKKLNQFVRLPFRLPATFSSIYLFIQHLLRARMVKSGMVTMVLPISQEIDFS